MCCTKKSHNVKMEGDDEESLIQSLAWKLLYNYYNSHYHTTQTPDQLQIQNTLSDFHLGEKGIK